MANYFVAYDLDSPGQNYLLVEKAVSALGLAIKIQYSMYYLKSNLSLADIENKIWASMDSNDRLIVIEAVNAQWNNLLPGASEAILDRWKN